MGPVITISALLMLALCACGGSSSKGTTQPETPASSVDGGGEKARTTPLDEAECKELLEHFIALFLEEQRAKGGPESVPTEAQVETIRRQFHDSEMQDCVGEDRALFDCAMAATEMASVAACFRPDGAVSDGTGGGKSPNTQ